MPSPFPGMDPYLENEKLWPDFQHQLINCLYQILLPGLVDRYRARILTREYVTEMPLFTSILRETHREEYIEIRQRTDNHLVTLIEVASPRNKTTATGRRSYHDTRQQARNCNAAMVEIDLSLQGLPLLESSRDGLPDWNYAITVTRSATPDRYEIYTTTLRKRLPRFKVPLAPDDRDSVLDLQSTFTRCYDQGNFAAAIAYREDPSVPLNEEDRKWVDEWLRQMRVR
jgi:Protein of unknown function (DUF4058)